MIRLRELREKKGLTQSKLGDIVGAKKSAISLWESGKRQPDNATLSKLADIYGVSVDYLLGRDPVDQKPTEDESKPSEPTREDRMLEMFRKMPQDEQENFIRWMESRAKQE